jgi:hypothetical protein
MNCYHHQFLDNCEDGPSPQRDMTEAEMFAFCQDVLLENYPSLEFHNDFIYCQMFGRVVKF